MDSIIPFIFGIIIPAHLIVNNHSVKKLYVFAAVCKQPAKQSLSAIYF